MSTATTIDPEAATGAKRPDDGPLITGNKTPAQVTRDVCAPLERKATPLWYGAFLLALTALGIGVVSVGYQIAKGIGTWGLNRTVGWAFDITNFVFWVGIGHAGTLISAVLLLFRQRWRTSINRSAEAMTIFAVICAGLYPVIHMGRPWLAYWVFPYPNMRGPLWVNFRSALLWDVFAIGTYFTISLLFWYVGLIPDLATVRDRAKGLPKKKIMGFLSLGWDGRARTWARYEVACVLLAALATPLVVSVHSVVSMDFATSVVPGWHTTVLPPYFVIGAVFSGFAMVLTLMLIARKVMNFEDYITTKHIHAMCKIMVFTGSIVGLAYATELFTAWYSGSPYERFAFRNRMFGPMAWSYWIMVSCNVIAPQLLWFRKVRNSHGGDLRDHPARERGHVVRALRHHRDLAHPRLPPVRLVGLCAHLDRGRFPDRRLRPLLHPLPPLLPRAADDRDVRGQDGGRIGDGDRIMNQRRYIGVFDDVKRFLAAGEACKEQGFEVVDAFTPYPMHEVDHLIGLKRSRLPWVTLCGGVVGLGLGLWFQYWATATDWPINVGGKPWDSLPAFMPVAFEVTVLIAGLSTVAALLLKSGLVPGRSPRKLIEGVSDDRFALVVRRGKQPCAWVEASEVFDAHGVVEHWSEEG